MLVSDFNYELPQELIAQQPPPVRGASRMMTLNRQTGAYTDRIFGDLPGLLRPGDLLVLNDSRVIPARLFATRGGLTTQHSSPSPAGKVEILLTEKIASNDNDWNALVRPARKVRPGETLWFAPASSAKPLLRATVLAAGEFGERMLRFDPVDDFYAVLDSLGHLPLPPYIHRAAAQPNTLEDRERYQTVFAGERGSAAAPTAGLHFTPDMLDRLHVNGIETAYITLHVGLGTFQPVRVETTEAIQLHAEHYSISAKTADAVEAARRDGRRIVAVGTTTTRTLEHLARQAEMLRQPIQAHLGSTSLFLSPGAEFKLVSGLLTNFHLPQSTLLMLVSAFAGRETTLAAYAHAVAERYRFFSYGDCMLIL